MLKLKTNILFTNLVFVLNVGVKIAQTMFFAYDHVFNGNPLAVCLSLGLAFGIEILIPEVFCRHFPYLGNLLSQIMDFFCTCCFDAGTYELQSEDAQAISTLPKYSRIGNFKEIYETNKRNLRKK